jgi:dTDP-4-dehydrorhamnose 3,5-epimerase
MNPTEITARMFSDSRGWFMESWSRKALEQIGIVTDFCQDNHSYSRAAYTLRGLHFQKPPFAQAKLVRCLRGRVFDVAVDIRTGSPSFGKWIACELSAERANQLFIPAGFAHGFLTLEDDCEVAYKVDSYYAPESEGGVIWDDCQMSIDWPTAGRLPALSDKDMILPDLSQTEGVFQFDPAHMLPLPAGD